MPFEVNGGVSSSAAADMACLRREAAGASGAPLLVRRYQYWGAGSTEFRWSCSGLRRTSRVGVRGRARIVVNGARRICWSILFLLADRPHLWPRSDRKEGTFPRRQRAGAALRHLPTLAGSIVSNTLAARESPARLPQPPWFIADDPAKLRPASHRATGRGMAMFAFCSILACLETSVAPRRPPCERQALRLDLRRIEEAGSRRHQEGISNARERDVGERAPW